MYNRIFWGIVLIGLGVFFILDQRGVVEFDLWDVIATYWPLILIYYGLKGLFFQYKWGNGVGFGYLYPILMTTIGVYFLGKNIDYIELSVGEFFQYVIPFILILIGIIIIFRPSKKRDRQEAASGSYEAKYGPGDSATASHADDEPSMNADPDTHADYRNFSDDAERPHRSEWAETRHDDGWQANEAEDEERKKPENHFSFIGDIHIGSANWQLKPLNVNHFIGDSVIDLTRASIPDGTTKISVGSFIGDVKVMLPNDPDVEASVTMSAFLGDFDVFGKREGGMMKNHHAESPYYQTARKKIRIAVNIFIGDFRIERI